MGSAQQNVDSNRAKFSMTTVGHCGAGEQGVKSPCLLNYAFVLLILATDKPVLVDFHTRWSAPCKQMASIVDGVAEKVYE